jgi:hypothetical protein
MNLKAVLAIREIKQTDIAYELGINPCLVSLQVNNRKQLPDCYIPTFCDLIGIDLIKFAEGKIVMNKAS